jgi:hypothetical protein
MGDDAIDYEKRISELEGKLADIEKRSTELAVALSTSGRPRDEADKEDYS